MRKLIVVAALAALTAAPVRAQEVSAVTGGPPSFYVGPYVGYMMFGNMFDFGNTEWSHEDGLFYGAMAGFSVNPNFSIIGNLGYTKSNATLSFDDGTTTAQESGDMGIFFYDAALQFRLPFGEQTGSWIAPFGQAGAGAVKYTFDTDDFNSKGETDIGFVLGVGADFQFSPMIGVRLLARDYITSLAWNDAQNVNFDDDAQDNVAHNWAVTVGLNFGF